MRDVSGYQPTPTLPEESDSGDLPERGTSIGRFLVLGSLGMGGMGMVLSAYDPDLDRKVALKLLRADVFREERAGAGREALVREAQAMARLSHPNVVTVHEVGAADEVGYVVMEQVEGRTLRAWLREAPRSWPEILDMLRGAGHGLAAAHAAGVVHRDFKPDNVLVGKDGRPRIADFGLSVGRTGIVGTPAYMAPEQLAGELGDQQVDQYAFCVTLWEALYGERPPSEPSLARPASGAPAWVQKALVHGLSRRPEDRWPSMDELLAALRPRAPMRLRLAVVAAAALALGSAAFLVGRARSSAPTCDGGVASIAPLWNDTARSRVAAAFQRTGRSYAEDTFTRVDAGLRRTLTAWRAVHRDACEATYVRHEQSDTMLDLRMRCLARARAEIASLIDLLGDADADAVARAVPAATRAGEVDACSDVARLGAAVPPPRDSATAKTVDAMRAEIARLVALHRLGRWKDGLHEGHELLARARALANLPVVASVLLQLAPFELDAGRVDAGIDLLYECVGLATAARDDDTVAEATTLLVHALGKKLRRFDAAEVAYRMAAAAVARTGPAPVHAIRLFEYRGSVLAERGDLGGALVLLQLSLALQQAHYGPDDYEVARSAAQVADAMDRMGQVQEAGRLYERARAMLANAVGPEHPAIVSLLWNYGFNRQHAYDYPKAAEVLERALAIAERAFGPEHAEVANVLYNLAIVREGQERLDEARAMIQRAIRIQQSAGDEVTVTVYRDVLISLMREQGDPVGAHELAEEVLASKRRVFGPEHYGVAFTMQLDAENLLALRRLPEARAASEAAVAMMAKTRGPETPDVADALRVQGRIETAQWRHRDAIATYERSIALLAQEVGAESPGLLRQLTALSDLLLDAGVAEHAYLLAEQAARAAAAAPPLAQAAAELRLVHARWVLGRDRSAAALAQARAARARLLAAPFLYDDLASVDRWLAQQR